MTHRTDSQKRRQHKAGKARATWGSATSRQLTRGTYLDEIRRHLARGRDAGRIAVWMSWPVSRVQEAIDAINRGEP